jgi:hypothetical protein
MSGLFVNPVTGAKLHTTPARCIGGQGQGRNPLSHGATGVQVTGCRSRVAHQGCALGDGGALQAGLIG